MSHGTPLLIPNAPVREAFLASPLTISQFAAGMGYWRTIPHTQRARKLLGLEPDHTRGRRLKTPREQMTYDNGLRAFMVLGLDPVDLDQLLES